MIGRMGRLGYFIRLCILSVLYGLGVLFFTMGGKGQSLNPVALLFLFLGSGILLVSFLSWLSATVRRLHDMDFSGWWVLLVCFFPVLIAGQDGGPIYYYKYSFFHRWKTLKTQSYVWYNFGVICCGKKSFFQIFHLFFNLENGGTDSRWNPYRKSWTSFFKNSRKI